MVTYTIQRARKQSFFSRYSVTTLLIGINVVCFLVFTLLLSLGVLPIDAIAIQPAHILSGAYLWTFVTSMFMHAGLFHLFANMLSLFFVGMLTEKLLGCRRYLWFYFLSGIAASLLFVLSSFVFPEMSATFAVGASGALFGVIGLLMLLVPNLPVYLMFIPIPVKMKYAAPGMLVVLWIISLAGNVPIGNTAHLGGFLFGVGYGLYLRKRYRNKTRLISKRFS